MEKGILGVLPRGPLRKRVLPKTEKGDTIRSGMPDPTAQKTQKTDPLSSVEESLKAYHDSYERALNDINCSMCRELLRKIKTLPLEKQVNAVPELRRFMDLAKSGAGDETMKAELKAMPVLMEVISA